MVLTYIVIVEIGLEISNLFVLGVFDSAYFKSAKSHGLIWHLLSSLNSWNNIIGKPLAKLENEFKMTVTTRISNMTVAQSMGSTVPISKHWDAFCFLHSTYTRKYPLRKYILGVLTHTTGLDRLWGGFQTLTHVVLKSNIHTLVLPRQEYSHLVELWPCGFKIE